MRGCSHITKIAPKVLLALLIAAPVFAEEVTNDGVEAWRALDEEFRQAMVEEISAKRGLDAKDQNPDSLIRSAKDIEEALRLSCEIVGDACKGLTKEGEELAPPPGYTPEQGFANGEAIRRAKAGLNGNEN